jgi:hypothetical protein
MKINRSYSKNVAFNFILFLVIALWFGWILYEPVTKKIVMQSMLAAPGFALIFSLFTYGKQDLMILD